MKNIENVLHKLGAAFKPARWILAGCWLSIAIACPAQAITPLEPGAAGTSLENDTMLMFVGEPLDVLVIATRREESAWQAPAVADVITREDMRAHGVSTLSEALALIPGFYMAKREGGSEAYLRGLSNSILFLYDTVPLGSEMTKSLQFLDHEISLASIKRIEIIRGPGSVLWGPDAFAGVVNIVPLTGQDVQGGEAGILFAEPGHQIGAFGHAGQRSGLWDTFFSTSVRRARKEDDSGNIARFWGDLEEAVPFAQRLGEPSPETSHYLEATGRVMYADRIALSGRLADTRRPYFLTEQDGDYTWLETKNVPSGYLKLEAKHRLGFESALRLTGSYRWLNPEYDIIDRTIEQKENTLYSELLFDHTFLAGRGLFTAGVSYRENHIEGAPIWDGYLPDYLGSDNPNLLPGLDQVDYRTRLASVFGQYTHKFGTIDVLLGLRYDDHDGYDDTVSYNVGTVWAPDRRWVLKLLQGTAFRTPYSRQLRADDTIEPEEVTNLSGQISWKPSNNFDATVIVFNNRIDHVMEDPYAGLSNSSEQTVDGLEFETHLRPDPQWEVGLNFTVLENHGPDITYRYNDYDFIRPDGTIEKHYTNLEYPYTTGPKRLLNLTLTWLPWQRLSTTAMLRYIGSQDLAHPRNDAVETCDAVWLLDWHTTLHGWMAENVDLDLTFRNLLDQDYKQPGRYRLIEGDPLTVQVMVRFNW